MTTLNDPKWEKTEEANKLRNAKQFDAKGGTIRELTEEESGFAVGAGSVNVTGPNGEQIHVEW